MPAHDLRFAEETVTLAAKLSHHHRLSYKEAFEFFVMSHQHLALVDTTVS